MVGLVLSGVVAGCAGDGATAPVAASDPAGRVATSIVAVSGDGQNGSAGELLPEPLVVRVTDADGQPVALARVIWSVEAGLANLGDGRPAQQPSEQDLFFEGGTRTNSDGLTRAWLFPKALGATEVSARVDPEDDGEGPTPVRFILQATSLVIHFGFDGVRAGSGCFDDEWWDNGIPYEFADPLCSANVRVPRGTPVEWVNHHNALWLESTAGPPGAPLFDAGTLGPGARFRFVPDVTGTWQFMDRLSGARGTLTVEP
jgi:hypothetical protein